MNAELDLDKIRRSRKATDIAISKAESLLNSIAVSFIGNGGIAIDYEVPGLCLTLEIKPDGTVGEIRK